MRTLKSMARSSSAPYVVFGFVVSAAVLAAAAIGNTTVLLAPLPKDYNGYRCSTDASIESARSTFKVLDLFRLNTDQLANRLCANPVIAARYDAVEVTWRNREQLDLRELVNRSYQLVLAKPELINRAAGSATGYLPFVRYEDYASQLIAIDSMPRLSIDYFKGKRLGLVDDPNSLSGYQVPKAALQSARIDESTLDIVYFKSHLDLHRALVANRVDVIASYSASYFGDKDTQRLDLRRGMTGLQWYLHSTLRDSPIHCALYLEFRRHPMAVGAPAFIADSEAGCTDAQ